MLTAPVAWFLIAAVAGVGALLAFSGDDPSLRSSRVETPSPTLAASVPTLPTTTTIPLPTTLDGLIAFLAGNPSVFGERGPDLFDALLELRDRPDGKRAASLLEDIDEWVADGELVVRVRASGARYASTARAPACGKAPSGMRYTPSMLEIYSALPITSKAQALLLGRPCSTVSRVS